MNSPLKEFKSENVRILLAAFYYQNFEEYGFVGSIGEKIVNSVWENKDLLNEVILKNKVDKLFNLAKKSKKQKIRKKESPTISLFDLIEVKYFLDYGANKLTLINELAPTCKNIQRFYAIDVVRQSKEFVAPEKCEYIQIDPQEGIINLKNNSVDFINISFVLHHLESEEDIKVALQEFKRILKPEGKILLWEESFEEGINGIESLCILNNSKDIFTNRNLTEEFYKLSRQERMEFIIINDWIVNVYNPHMQWTGQWKQWEKWVSLFKEEGFSLVEKYNLGLRLNGKVKQGVHMIGLFQIDSGY